MRFRINPFAYDYYRSVPASVLRRAEQTADPMATSSHEDDITCVICMNFVHYEADEHGGLVSQDSSVQEIVAVENVE